MRRHARIVFVLLSPVLAIGCSDDGPVDPVDASAVDAPPAGDGAMPDAGGPCPGQLVFTGGYEDWDSTLANFDGIEFATVTQREDPGNTAQTAPNGRVMMCVAESEPATFDFVQPDYLDMRYTMSPGAQAIGPFEVRGLTPLRAEDLFSLELGLTLDDAAGQVLVAIRRYPDDEPAYGARASLGNANAGTYTNDGQGRYVAGDQLTTDSYLFFANVDPGTTTVTVTAPPNHICLGTDTLEVVPGALSATTFACVMP